MTFAGQETDTLAARSPWHYSASGPRKTLATGFVSVVNQKATREKQDDPDQDLYLTILDKMSAAWFY